MAMAEVYEVATFYHHFDVVKEGDTAPPAITVRVCDSIACDLAGSHELLATLPALLGTGRPRAARAVRRPLRDGAGRGRRTESGSARDAGERRARWCRRRRREAPAATARSHPHLDIVTPGHIDYAAYRAAGGYALAAACVGGANDARRRHRRDGETPGCAALAAPASPPAASGSSSRPSPRRA